MRLLTNDMSKSWNTFWLAAATVFMVSLDTTVVVAAFPALRSYFAGTSPALLSWTLNGYTIVYASLLVPFGRMVDRVGLRRCFLAGVAGFTLASAGCAFAVGPWSLICARVVQAGAAAMLTPASLALILAAFPSEQRQRVAGLWSAVGALAASLGPVIGSALIEWWSWRMIFLINLPVGIAVVSMGWRRLETRRASEVASGFDALGTLLLIAGVALVAGGLTQAEHSPWASFDVALPLVSGVAVLAAFGLWAKGREDAALDLRLFSDANYRWASAATLVLGAGFGMMFLSFYLFFTGVWGFAQSYAGLAAVPGPLIATTMSIIVSSNTTKWSRRNLLVAGGLLYALSNAWLVMRVSATPAYFATWLPGQIVGGIAIGLMLPSLAGAAVARLQPSSLGVGSAVNNAIRQLGGSLGVALAIGMAGGSPGRVDDFKQVYLTLVVMGLLIAALSLGITDQRHQSKT